VLLHLCHGTPPKLYACAIHDTLSGMTRQPIARWYWNPWWWLLIALGLLVLCLLG
jgi:hypothetical protein